MRNQEIRVSLDGGATFQEAKEGVRVVYPNVLVDGEDGTGEVHVNLTTEGIITDVWTTRDKPLDYNIGTESRNLDNIVTDLVAQNA